LLGLAYCLPVVVWSLGRGLETYNGLFDAGPLAARILILVQAVVITFWIPWYGKDGPWFGALREVLGLILIPLPLVTVLWLTGAGSAMILVGAEVALMAFAALLLVGVRSLPLSTEGLFVPAVAQVAGITALWMFRDAWLGWLGL